jgi:predicted membrane-bound spermidine synthase
VQLLLAFAPLALLLVASRIAALPWTGAEWMAAEVVFPAMAAAAGVLGGFQFVTAAGIFLGEGGSRQGLGALYAVDLLGGCAGALALSGFLIPVYGFRPTAWLTAAVNLAAAAAVSRSARQRVSKSAI